MIDMFDKTIVVRGAGDIASGIIHRLQMCGFRVVVLEIENPTVVRRKVSFADAVFEGETEVEGVKAILAGTRDEIEGVWSVGAVPVVVDRDMNILSMMKVDVLIDATLAKRNMGVRIDMADITIGVGPGFFAGADVDAVVETLRGHELGRVIYKGGARKNTGIPSNVCGFTSERVLRAPKTGEISNVMEIGDYVKSGDVIASVDGADIKAGLDGVIRGLIKDGTRVDEGLKVGDVDPRGIYDYCFTISEKARAVAGGVLEAMLHIMSGGF